MASGLGGIAARGGAIILGSQMLRFVLMMASTVILARLISPASYGLFAMVTALVTLADVLRDMGLSMVALRTPSLTSGQKSNLFWLSCASGLILAGVVYFCAPLISAFYGAPELTAITEVLAITFFVNSVGAQFRVQINRDMRFGVLAVTDLLPYAIGFVVATVLALGGAEYWALAWQLVAVAVASLVISVPLARWFPGLPAPRENMRSLFAFGSAFVGSQLVTYSMRNADSVAIGRVWGATALGPYDRAYQLTMIPINNLISPLGRVAIPVMARAERARLGHFARTAHLAIAYLTVGPYLLLAGLSGPVVAVLLGTAWSAASPILFVLAIGGAFRGMAQISNWMYVAVGGAAKFLRLQIATQAGVVVFMLAGVFWGPVGVAAGHSIGFALYWVVTLVWSGRELGIEVRPLLRDGLRVSLSLGVPALLIGAAASASGAPSWLQRGVGIAAFFAWLGLLLLVSKRTRHDLLEVKRLRKRS